MTLKCCKGERMGNYSYIETVIKCKKNIALIAHDNKKQELIQWCTEHKDVLCKHNLCGTGTTASLVSLKTGLEIQGYNSGPLGGDQQIGSRIVDGEIDLMIFFSDPLTAQPHDPDVKALLRIAQLYDIPIAHNRSSADFIITSKYMDETYVHHVINYKESINKRVSEF